MGNFFSKSDKNSPVKQPQENLGTKKSEGASSRQETILPSQKTTEKETWAAKDTEQYRKRYPDKKDDPDKGDNLLFYTNQLGAKPDDDTIDDIHDKWYGDYKTLEQHQGYIQWLFPNRIDGMNKHAQALQLHEIKAILQDTTAKKRVLTSYKLMLHYYGMRLKDEKTGEIEREENWQERFLHLNKSSQEYLRITRILKCLGEFEYEHLKAPFVKFVLNEGLVHKTLDNLVESCVVYWIGVIRDDAMRKGVMDYSEKAKDKKSEEEDKKSSVNQPQENLGTHTCQDASSRQETILPSQKTTETENWAAKDMEEYRNGYPGKKDDPDKTDNLKFYSNQLTAKPDGDKIDDIHDKWYGDYKKLEQHHGYIQWLFPNRTEGINRHAQALQLHEIKAILQDTTAKKRVLTSYKLMLHYYGMRLKDEETGEIEREENWQERFLHLNKSSQENMRITRILKCLGEFEYEHLKAPFVKFVLNEGLVHKTLDNLAESCKEYWIWVIRDDVVRKGVMDYYEKAKDKKAEEENSEMSNEGAENMSEDTSVPVVKSNDITESDGSKMVHGGNETETAGSVEVVDQGMVNNNENDVNAEIIGGSQKTVDEKKELANDMDSVHETGEIIEDKQEGDVVAKKKLDNDMANVNETGEIIEDKQEGNVDAKTELDYDMDSVQETGEIIEDKQEGNVDAKKELDNDMESLHLTGEIIEDKQEENSVIDSIKHADKNFKADGTEVRESGTDELISDVGTVEDGTEGLKTGTNELISDLCTVEDGTEGLKTGTDELISDVGTVEDSTEGLKTGTDELISDVGTVEDGTEGLKTGTDELISDVCTVEDGTEGLKTGTDELISDLCTVEDGTEGLKTGTDELISDVGTVEDSTEGLKTGTDELISDLCTVEDGTEGLKTGTNELISDVGTVEDVTEGLKTGTNELISDVGTVEDSTEGLKTGTDTVISVVGTVEDSTDVLKTGTDELISEIVEDSTEGLKAGNDIKEAYNIANGTSNNTPD